MNLISRVFALNFKIKEVDQVLSWKTIFTGPNGAGKSAHSDAIFLAYYGHIGEYKRPADIVKNYGLEDQLKVGFECGKTKFERRFSINSKGQGTTSLYLNGSKVGAMDYTQALMGVPKIINLKEFLDLSDQKKIKHLLSLYPKIDGLTMLAGQIESLENKKTELQSKIRTCESMAGQLSRRVAESELPSGTLAEIQAQINETKTEIKNLEATLQDIERREAVEEDQKNREAEMDQRAKEAFEKAVLEGQQKHDQLSLEKNQWKTSQVGIKSGEDLGPLNAMASPDAYTSLSIILDTMDRSGCDVCAARLVCIREMKKFG